MPLLVRYSCNILEVFGLEHFACQLRLHNFLLHFWLLTTCFIVMKSQLLLLMFLPVSI